MKRETPSYRERITQDPNIRAGKPVIRGTRIPVERVFQHLEDNDRADLFAAFPELTEDDVRACLVDKAHQGRCVAAVSPGAKDAGLNQ